MPKAEVIIITGKIAKPSNPSVKLTAFELPTIINIEINMKKIPKSKATFLKKGTM